MKNRRSFLKMIGLGAVAAPVAAKLAVEVEAAPLNFVSINDGPPIMLGKQLDGEIWRDWAKNALKAMNSRSRPNRGWIDG
jgi:hypothetical protein